METEWVIVGGNGGKEQKPGADAEIYMMDKNLIYTPYSPQV